MHLRLEVFGYPAAPAVGKRPVSRAQRSTLLQRQTDERPSLPSGFGKPGLVASTFTRCGERPSLFATSTAITSSVRESICIGSPEDSRQGLLQINSARDQNGVPGPLQIHHNFTGVITNPEGETFDDRAAYTELIDIAGDFDESNDTLRQVGKIYGITVPGAGIIAHDTGVITFYPDGTVTFQGPHTQFLAGDALLCAALG